MSSEGFWNPHLTVQLRVEDGCSSFKKAHLKSTAVSLHSSKCFPTGQAQTTSTADSLVILTSREGESMS